MTAPEQVPATSPLPAPSGARYQWVDVIKGFGIILVVLGHAVRGLEAPGLISDTLLEALDTRIYAFHMPLFFFVSGFFLAKSLEKSTPKQFLKTRVTQLLYPLVLWTYIFLLFKFAAGSLSNHPIGLDGVLVSPIPGRDHMWFLWALILIQLFGLMVWVIVGTVIGQQSRSQLSINIALAAAIALFFLPTPEPWIPYVRQAQLYGFYVFAGTALFLPLQKLEMNPTMALVAGIIFIAGIALAPTLLFTPLMTPALAIILTLSATLVIRWIGNSNALSWLANLGVASLAVYVSHTIFSAGIREVLRLAHVESTGIHLLAGTLLGLIAPWILYRLAMKQGWARWVGWR